MSDVRKYEYQKILDWLIQEYGNKYYDIYNDEKINSLTKQSYDKMIEFDSLSKSEG